MFDIDAFRPLETGHGYPDIPPFPISSFLHWLFERLKLAPKKTQSFGAEHRARKSADLFRFSHTYSVRSSVLYSNFNHSRIEPMFPRYKPVTLPGSALLMALIGAFLLGVKIGTPNSEDDAFWLSVLPNLLIFSAILWLGVWRHNNKDQGS